MRSKKVSKRLEHVRIDNGYCLVCDNYGKLSWDHVPPKGAVGISSIEQKHLVEAYGGGDSFIKGVRSSNGSKFRTICADCNETIGRFDEELIRVNKEAIIKASNHFSTPNSITNIVSIECNVHKYLRAVAGHVLSATSVQTCIEKQGDSRYFTPLKKFVLAGEDIFDSHDVYYWFYPHRSHISAKIFSMYYMSSFTVCSVLAFYPISFIFFEKDKGIAPTHAKKITPKDTKLTLDLSTRFAHLARFPFIDFKNQHMIMALDETQVIISYPIGQSKKARN